MATENERSGGWAIPDFFNQIGGIFNREQLRFANRTEQQAGAHNRASELFIGGVENLGWVDNLMAGISRALGRIVEFFTGEDTFGLIAKSENLVSQHREIPETYNVDGPDGHDTMTNPGRRTAVDATLDAGSNAVTTVGNWLNAGAQANENMISSGYQAVGLGDFVQQGGLIGLFRREVLGHENTAPIDINPMNWFQADATAGTPTPDTATEFDSAAPNTPENQERDRALNEGTPAIPVTGQTLEATRGTPALVQ